MDSQVGTGAEATFGKTVTVNYNAWRYDISAGKFESTPFDSSYSRNQPFPFVLGAGTVIEGWDQGVIGMKVGGTRTLIIPSLLGYGANGAGSTVPPNTPLMFTVTLLGVQ
ncbi:MAG TPA: FKBP-type peptidyl-prolyl cis-trans isomerase [Burkholderiaceae bacterium]